MARSGNSAFFDEAFGQIAQRAGSLPALLDEFFDFLHRRTDFYVTFPMPTDRTQGQQYKMGFPEGKAEDMVLKALRKRKFKDYAEVAEAHTTAPKKEPVTKSSPSPAATTLKPQPARLTEKGQQIPIGNGGVAEKYYWTQTLTDTTVYVDAPVGVTSKSVQCTITASTLRLVVDNQTIIDGALDGPVRPQESVWTISKGDAGEHPQIVVTLEKVREAWWSKVGDGHPEIDTNKVDSSKNIDEYDADTQAAIRKIMFEQRQKMMGLPTEEDIKVAELMSSLPDPPV